MIFRVLNSALEVRLLLQLSRPEAGFKTSKIIFAIAFRLIQVVDYENIFGDFAHAHTRKKRKKSFYPNLFSFFCAFRVCAWANLFKLFNRQLN